MGGPQIGYNYPGLTLEMDLHGPDIHVRGATSAPFPGYMLIGRGEDYAWTLTSAAGDIIDTYAETLCGGSKVRYLYKGKCRAMESVDAGTISKGGKSVHVKFRRTVHGPVYGYAKARGTNKQVALSTRRSSYGRETVDQLFFQQMTYGRVHSANDFIRAAYKTPQTFNSFYASANESAFITSGRAPAAPEGRQPRPAGQRRGQVRVDGLPAPTRRTRRSSTRRPATSSTGTTSRPRTSRRPTAAGTSSRCSARQLLTGELGAPAQADARDASWPRPTPRRPRTCASSSCGRRSSAMLDRGKAPNARDQRIVDLLQAWHDAGGSRRDADRDGRIDDPGAPIIDAAWKGLTDAGLCDRLGGALCNQLERRNGRFDQPPGGQYGGWHQYMWKDLRAKLGQKVAGEYNLRYCGNGSVKTCSKELWARWTRRARRSRRSRAPTRPRGARPRRASRSASPRFRWSPCSTRTSRPASTR